MVRFTRTNNAIQKIANIVFNSVLNLFSINSGIVYNPFSIKIGKKYFPTISKVIAAIHSYDAIANPKAKPDPDMPMNCSAEILAAIKDAPIAHQGKDLLAKKYLNVLSKIGGLMLILVGSWMIIY